MNIRPVIVKIGTLLLTLSLLTATATACSAEQKISAKKVIGTVDGNPICYDELYALSGHYAAAATFAANGDAQATEVELDRLVQANIVTNTAILRLCESKGLTYKQSKLDDQIDDELQLLLTSTFGGDEDAFRADMTENHLTERYLRYTTGLNLLYEQLPVQYPSLGLVVSEEDAVRQYIQEHFVHTYHVVRFYNEENQAEQYAKMQEALRLLQSGTTMYELIRRGYSEDFGNPSGSGYYFTNGSMEDVYESAAFSLSLHAYSEIIDAHGYDNNGGYSSCYYIIQREPLDADYIDTHLNELQDEYYAGVIDSDLRALQATLTFEPNDFYHSLTLTDLSVPREGLPGWGWALIIGGGVLVVGGGITLTVVLLRKKAGRNSKHVAARSKA